MASDLDRLLARALQQSPQNTITPQPQTVLDTAAVMTSPVPGAGDLVGLLADANAMRSDPSLAHLGMMLAGALPFVPGGAMKRLPKTFDDVIESAARADSGARWTKQRRWRIWDTKEKKWASAPYNNKKRARTRMDKLDNEYGAYRYQVKEYED